MVLCFWWVREWREWRESGAEGLVMCVRQRGFREKYYVPISFKKKLVNSS